MINRIGNRINKLRRLGLVSWLVATRTVRRSSLSLKLVTVLILTLTFLNLTVVGGILRGITKDVGTKIQDNLVGDVFIEPNKDYEYIQQGYELLDWLESDQRVTNYSPRLLSTAVIESDYQDLRRDEKPQQVKVGVGGVDEKKERAISGLGDKMVLGRFLEEDDRGVIVLGAGLVDGYTNTAESSQETLGEIKLGDKVRVRVSDGVYEFKVVGIMKTKASTVDQRAYITERDMRQITGEMGKNYSEVAVVVESEMAEQVKEELKNLNLSKGNEVKLAEEAMPGAVADLQKAFFLIENIVGLISVLVSLVTVFVIVFINALSRRRQLGILKAQGIEPGALIFSYVLQAVFYAVIAILLGVVILIGPLRQFFMARPVSLPMADGYLALSTSYVSLRGFLLLLAAIVSGFIPAWMVVRQNTLDAILGRN